MTGEVVWNTNLKRSRLSARVTTSKVVQAPNRRKRACNDRAVATHHDGAREENRTPDLLITSELLCRLSYPGGRRKGSSRPRQAGTAVSMPGKRSSSACSRS